MGAPSNPLRPRSIRGQLVMLIAALAVPLVALQGWWSYRQFLDAEVDADSQALVVADATATGIRQFLTVAEQVLTVVASRFGGDWIEAGRCVDGIDNVTTYFPLLVNAVAIRPDGEIICSASPVPAGTTAESWVWLPELMETGRFTIGDPILGTLSQTWIIPLAVPIFDEDGDIVGALAGSMPLIEFGPFLDPTHLQAGELVTVATADRIVLARSTDAARWIGGELPSPTGSDREVAPGRTVARGPDLEGVQRVWGQVETVNGWIVYVGIPAASVVGPARAEFARRFGSTLLIVILGILVAGVTYRHIGRALRELAAGTADGEGVRVALPEATPLEVKAVVERFNKTLEGRNAAQLAERAARERYQSIFDNAVFGLYVSTIDGRFLQANAALAAMLGFDSVDALIDAGTTSLYTSPRIREELVAQATDLGRIDDWEINWLRADGVPITVRLNGRTIPGPDEEPLFEMIVQDITDERRTEDELRQTQKMEAIGKLAGGIAHDFNNLLTVIGGNLELIEDGLPDDHELRADLDQIREATQRAGTLTAQLLAFARREPRGARNVEVNDVLRDMERLLVRLIGEDVELDARLSARPTRILIDPSELEQVVMNLVLNARDAMPMGGSVLIETRSVDDQPGPGDESSSGAGVLLSVRDSGMGMDRETVKRIFEPFYTTKPTGEGTGLGLSTVYGIVQRAHGHVSVESEPGYGTTFRIWFPLSAEEPARAVAVRVGPATASGGSERILVVEDEDLVRGFVRRALEDAGYEIVAAADGEDALALVQSEAERFDLVLTDVVMPRMSGTELAERLEVTSPHTPVLFMSGYLQNQELAARLRENPDVLLRKPFSSPELCSRVRRALDVGYAREATY